MNTTYRGTLTGFSGSWMSGVGHLIIDGKPVMCENGATVRALQGAFGDVIDRGHKASIKEAHEIIYSVDDLGMLLGFTPVEDWEGPEIPPEGITETMDGRIVNDTSD